MRIIVITPQGKFEVNLIESDIHQFALNEYAEEIVECYK